MKQILILILLPLLSIFTYSQNSRFYSNLQLSDTVKTINKNMNYPGRLYFFTNIDPCQVCIQNIETLYQKYGDFLEFVVFIDDAKDKDLESIRKFFSGGYQLIGDEHGLYKEYYKIKYQPVLLLLDNDGVVLGWDKVTAIKLNLDSIFNELQTNFSIYEQSNYVKSLKEVKRIEVRQDTNPVITSIYRKCLFNKKDSKFILSNMRLPELFIIDTTGVIKKEIAVIDYPTYDIISFYDMSWAEQDSVLFIYGTDNLNLLVQYFNIELDSFSTAYKSSPCNLIERYCASSSAQFLTSLHMFVNNEAYYSNKKNEKLSYLDTTLKVNSYSGELIKEFGTPDSVYLNFRQSKLYSVTYAYFKEIIYTLESNSDLLKLWDKNGKHLKTIKLYLGNRFKRRYADHNDEYNEENLRDLWNSISFHEALLINPSNSSILFSFRNESYPEGVYDYLSNEVKYETIINIYNSDGVKLNKNDIIMPKGTIPFHFEDNKIYTTEMNGNKLEIAIYEFIED